jgi:PQQ-dependent catabolism-associated beta-propeller protein
MMTSRKFTRRESIALMAAFAGAAAVGTTVPARAAGTGYLYVSHERSHNVLVLDPAREFATVADIATSRRPRDMHFNNAHTLLYVACGDDDVIDVIDVATHAVVDQIPTGRSPEAFVLSHDETTIYVSNEENSTCQVIDIASKLIIHEIPVGAEPEGVLLSPDGRTLYVTSEVADMVHVIDPVLGVVTQNIIVGTRPRRFALSPDERELWVSDELSGQISIIDVATNQVLTDLEFLPPGFRPVDVTPVGLTLMADNRTMAVSLGRANHIAYVNTATREIEGYTLVGSRAWNVCNSADGSQLYVTNGLSDDISIIDVASRRNILSVPVGRVPYAVLVDAPV